MIKKTYILKYLVLGFFSLLAFTHCSQGQVESKSYNFMLNRILERNVPEISVQKLEESSTSYVLLDTREDDEYAVSHMKNAIHVGYDHFDLNKVPKDKNQKIVVYCSVGYRSEKITQRLQKMGYTNVYNLFGGIFEWVNQENAIYKNEKKTQKIHAYSKMWGMWLNNGEKVYN
jgi:rhodanese-related sulfurtransferase